MSWNRLPDLALQAALAFRSRSEGWLGGPSGAGFVYSSSDGGVTWQEVPLPVGHAGLRQAGWLQGGSSDLITLLPPEGVVVLDQATDEMYVSEDAGSSWHRATLPASLFDYTQVSFLDSVHWWLIQGTVLFKTADAGLTWSDTGEVVYDHLSPTIIDAKHAWARVQTTDDSIPGLRPNTVWELDLSVDGGLQWKTMTVPIPG
jgi:hypothetical protein